MNSQRRYDCASAALVVVSFFLLFLIRTRLPVVSDSWYHLGVIRAFYERGISLHDWWEYAPAGRPHLYSPLFHVIGATVLRFSDLNLLELARWSGVVTFPLLLAAGWGAARMLFGACAAFLTVLLLAGNIGLLFPCSLVMMPGTYALMLWPFLPVLVMRRWWLGAGMMLLVMAYLHFGVAGFGVISLVLFAALRREYWKPSLLAISVGVAGFSPWLVHLVRHREYLHSGTVSLSVFIPVFSAVGAGVGIWSVVRQREKEGLAVVALLVVNGLLWFTMQDRFWLHCGFLFALLGGHGIERVVGRHLRWVAAVLVVCCVTMTPFLKPSRMKLGIPVRCQSVPGVMGTPLLTLAEWQRGAELPEAVSQDIGELSHWILKNVGKDEILITDIRHLGSYLFVLTGRRTTSGGWGEVMTGELQQQVAAYRQEGRGYLVVPVEKVAEFQGKRLVSFGRFAVLQR